VIHRNVSTFYLKVSFSNVKKKNRYAIILHTENAYCGEAMFSYSAF
jgi:hypothetical protein